MEIKFWGKLDSVADKVGRACRNGNGWIRSIIAGAILIGMILYPFIKM